MGLYRKRPVVIEAVQFTEAIAHACVLDREPLPAGVVMMSCHYHPGRREVWDARFAIETSQGQVAVKSNDWIVTATNGERYPCGPETFEATYEPAATSEEGVDSHLSGEEADA